MSRPDLGERSGHLSIHLSTGCHRERLWHARSLVVMGATRAGIAIALILVGSAMPLAAEESAAPPDEPGRLALEAQASAPS